MHAPLHPCIHPSIHTSIDPYVHTCHTCHTWHNCMTYMTYMTCITCMTCMTYMYTCILYTCILYTCIRVYVYIYISWYLCIYHDMMCKRCALDESWWYRQNLIARNSLNGIVRPCSVRAKERDRVINGTPWCLISIISEARNFDSEYIQAIGPLWSRTNMERCVFSW
jgi:hypothetical protein